MQQSNKTQIRMKKFRNTGPMDMRRVLGGLHIQRRILPTLAVAAGLVAVSNAFGTEINLVTGTTIDGVAATTSGSFPTGTSAGGAGTIYELIDTHPAGTGVFQPFLSYQHKGQEEGINTSQLGNGQGVLDDKRVPQWTHDVHVGDLGTITRNGVNYFAFELDANEKGSGNPDRLLSIDDIRIYTSASSPFVGGGGTIGNDSQAHTAINADSATLGSLRYAQNEPNGTANFVLIDASRRTEGSTSGSGSSDMLVLVPQSLFDLTHPEYFLTFYTLNGVHELAEDDGSDAGFEEWRYLAGAAVPDGGSTLLLLGSALIPLGLLRARRESKKA
jgi:hypothetical protein